MTVNRFKTRISVVALAAALCLALAGPVAAAGPRLSVTMDQPFVVDGHVYPAGTLSLRPVREFTPTTTLNEIWVGDRCLGLLMARRSLDPRLEAARNSVMFARDDDGRLELRGFAFRLGNSRDRYRYELLVPSVDRVRADRVDSRASGPFPTEPWTVAARVVP